jgi:hypothetical protein
MRDARDLYTKCVDITPEMALQLIKVRPLLFFVSGADDRHYEPKT